MSNVCAPCTDMPDDLGPVSRLLNDLRDGKLSPDEAYKLLSDLIRAIANREMSNREKNSIRVTQMVDDVFLGICQNSKISWQGRNHFLAYVCTEIKNRLVDHSRKRNAQKRGGGQAVAGISGVPEPSAPIKSPEEEAELQEEQMRFEEARDRFAIDHPDLNLVLQLRLDLELSFEVMGWLLEIDPGTARRQWFKASVLLQKMLQEQPGSG